MVSKISALGLDIGNKRIGVAGCDGLGLFATGLTTIERKSFEQVIAELQYWVKEREVQVLVVGLPYSIDGSLGFQAQSIKKFAENLCEALNLPVEYVDERLSSVQAEEIIISQKRSPSRNKALIDRKAAALILQRWLDTNSFRPKNAPP
jgi:putative holliday junction resolvase